MSEYDVVLEDVGTDRLMVMHVIRTHPRNRLSPTEARGLIDTTPATVIENGDRGEAYEFARQLRNAGGQVRVVRRFYEIAAACYGPDAEPIRLSDTVTREVPEDEWARGGW